MTDERRITELRYSLEKVRDLAKPGQTLDIHSAIDLICDIYNEARTALRATEPNAPVA